MIIAFSLETCFLLHFIRSKQHSKKTKDISQFEHLSTEHLLCMLHFSFLSFLVLFICLHFCFDTFNMDIVTSWSFLKLFRTFSGPFVDYGPLAFNIFCVSDSSIANVVVVVVVGLCLPSSSWQHSLLWSIFFFCLRLHLRQGQKTKTGWIF